MAEDKNQTNLDKGHSKKVIKFDYIKSRYFRVIHADGVSGGTTPNLDIHIAFWNERPSIPEHVEYEETSSGEVIERIDAPEAIIREVEVSMILNIDTAQIIIDWLQEQVEEVQSYIYNGEEEKDLEAENNE